MGADEEGVFTVLIWGKWGISIIKYTYWLYVISGTSENDFLKIFDNNINYKNLINANVKKSFVKFFKIKQFYFSYEK